MAMVAFFPGRVTSPTHSCQVNWIVFARKIQSTPEFAMTVLSKCVCVCVCVCVSVCVCIQVLLSFLLIKIPSFCLTNFVFLLTTIQFFDARFLANPSASRKKRHHHLLQKDIKLVSLQVPRNHSQQCTRPVGTLFLGHFNKNWDGLLFCFCFWSICFGHAH